MPESQLPPVDSADVADQSPHYVRAVTDMGEDREIVAHEDIYAANGMKLCAKGARINRSQYDRLNVHKLRVPLDLSLSTEQTVDPALLAVEANRLVGSDPVMARMAQRAGDPLGFRQVLGMLPLPQPLQFRLTVMREKRNELFNHSLRTALISHSIAVRLGLSLRQKEDLLLAAICHDLGEMHTDPALLEPGHRIAPDERRYIHVHPVTSYVLLRELPGISPAVMQAVLQHHERLDGSGYPHALTEAQIHPLAKLLCLSEVMEAVLRRADLQRLDVLLRLNRRRFDPEAIGVLHELFRAGEPDVAAAPEESDVAQRINRLVDVLRVWRDLREGQGVKSDGEHGFLQERMDLLRSLMLQAGIDQNDTTPLLDLAHQDADVMRELQATLDELDWVMRDIANEIGRREATHDDASRRLVNLLVG